MGPGNGRHNVNDESILTRVARQLDGVSAPREAQLLMKLGLPDQAAERLETWLKSNPDPELRPFLLRELVPIRMELGQIDEGLVLAGEAARLGVERWGATDPRSLILRNTQMYWLATVGQVEAALALCQPLLADADQHLGAWEPLRSAIRNNSARVFEQADRGSDARRLYRQLLADYSRWGLASSEPACSTRHNFARHLQDTGELAEALQVLQQQLAIVTELRGTASEESLLARHDVAEAHLYLDQRRTAIEQWELLLRDCRDHLEADHPLIAEILGILLTDAVDLDDPERAVFFCDQLIDLAEEGPEPSLTEALVRMRSRLAQTNAE